MAFSEKTASVYDSWFETKAGMFADKREKALIKSALRGIKTTVLEAGSGTGRYLEFLSELGLDAKGIEISPDMVKIADSKEKIRGKTLEGNAESLPFKDNEFEAVLFMTSLEFISDKKAAVKEALRVAEKKVIICFLNKYGNTNKKRAGLNKESYENAVFLSAKDIKELFDKNIKMRPVKYALYSEVDRAYKCPLFEKAACFFNFPLGNFGVMEIVLTENHQ